MTPDQIRRQELVNLRAWKAQALVLLRERSTCKVVHVGYPEGFTCLDKKRDAVAFLAGEPTHDGGTYNAVFAADLATGTHLCKECVVYEFLEGP